MNVKIKRDVVSPVNMQENLFNILNLDSITVSINCFPGFALFLYIKVYRSGFESHPSGSTWAANSERN